MKQLTTIFAVLLLVVLIPYLAPANEPQATQTQIQLSQIVPQIPTPDLTASTPYPVAKVIDGDTIVVQDLDPQNTITIRLIGIDTPETVHPSKQVEAFARQIEVSYFKENTMNVANLRGIEDFIPQLKISKHEVPVKIRKKMILMINTSIHHPTCIKCECVKCDVNDCTRCDCCIKCNLPWDY